MAESPTILRGIADVTGASSERVEAVVSALRLTIDALFLDGYTVFAPPFSLTYRTDPIAPLFADRWESASDAEISAWYACDMEAAAKWLGVSLVDYLRHPVASELHVLMNLFEELDIEDADSPEGVETASIAGAWFDTFTGERRYSLSTVGLERDLEAWLIHHTERLVQIGYDVRLRQQQFVLPDRRRPDLVFDLLEDDGSTGTLIVELKATSGYLGAVDQLVGYMDTFVSLGLANGVLRGLLVADGFPPDVLAYTDAKGIDTATLTELGYRRDLAGRMVAVPRLKNPRERPTAEGQAPMNDLPSTRLGGGDSVGGTEPDSSTQTFIVYSHPLQVGEPTPVMYVDAEGLDAVPTDVRPYDPADAGHRSLASSLMQSVQDHPEFNTVGHIAVSYGAVTYADGKCIATENSDAAVPAYYLAWGESAYDPHAYEESASDAEPFLRLIAHSLADPVIEVEPVGTPGWEHSTAREYLANEALTPRQRSSPLGWCTRLIPRLGVSVKP